MIQEALTAATKGSEAPAASRPHISTAGTTAAAPVGDTSTSGGEGTTWLEPCLVLCMGR